MTMIVALLAFVAIGCGSNGEIKISKIGGLDSISPEQWRALRTRAIYFGHRSVGDNIIEGVRALLARHPEPRLNLESGSIISETPALHELRIGKNGDTDSKDAAFLSTTDGHLGPRPVLMFKYCYVDMTEKTDVDAFFQISGNSENAKEPASGRYIGTYHYAPDGCGIHRPILSQ
jgi:hypothetical protein